MKGLCSSKHGLFKYISLKLIEKLPNPQLTSQNNPADDNSATQDD